MGFASADVGWDPVLGTREEYRYISRFLHGWTTHKDLYDIPVHHLSSEIIDWLTQKPGSSKSKYHLYKWDRQARKMLLIWVEIMGLQILHASVQWTNSFTEVIGHCCPSLGGAEWNGFFLQTDPQKGKHWEGKAYLLLLGTSQRTEGRILGSTNISPPRYKDWGICTLSFLLSRTNIMMLCEAP